MSQQKKRTFKDILNDNYFILSYVFKTQGMDAKLNHIYVYYDGPQVFSVKSNNSDFLCMSIDDDNNYLCVFVEEKDISDFESGNRDLRSFFEENDSVYFKGKCEGEQFTLYLINHNEIQQDWLPDEGFFLNKIG